MEDKSRISKYRYDGFDGLVAKAGKYKVKGKKTKNIDRKACPGLNSGQPQQYLVNRLKKKEHRPSTIHNLLA